MKLGLLVSNMESLNKLVNKKMIPNKAIELVGFIKEVSPEVVAFDNFKSNLFQKYGESKENKTTIKKENQQIFIKEINEYLQKEVEIKIPDLSITDIDDSIEPIILMNLSWLVKS